MTKINRGIGQNGVGFFGKTNYFHQIRKKWTPPRIKKDGYLFFFLYSAGESPK